MLEPIKRLLWKFGPILLCILTIVFGVLVFGASYWGEHTAIIGSIQNTIYFLTLVVLVWYSYETRQMRINQFRPFISAYFVTPKGAGVSFLYLKNIGAGPAHQVTIRLVGFIEQDGKRDAIDEFAVIGTMDRNSDIQVSQIGDGPTNRAIIDSVLTMRGGDLHIYYSDLNDVAWCGHYRKAGNELMLISHGRN